MSYQALLFCPEEKTARVVTQVLSELDFTVEPCTEPFAAVKKLMAQHFDAVVVDCDNEQNATLLFKSARNSGPNQNSLSVAVVEGQAGVAKAFRIGANLVLTKPINVEQSKGTLRVARGLLRKAESGKVADTNSPGAEPSLRPAPVALNFAPTSAATPTVQKPVPVPELKTAPGSDTPAGTASGFELEEEPAPQPEPTEAALLESMPEALPPAGKATPPSAGVLKEHPWQPVRQAASEPMASALRRAREAVAKPAEGGASTAAKTTPPPRSFADTAKSDGTQLSGSAAPLGQGAAAAPAPAKESSRSAVKTPELKPSAWPAPVRKEVEGKTESVAARGTPVMTVPPVVEPPTFSALGVKDHEESEPGGSKKRSFLALAIVVIIAAAYFGWTKLHVGNQSARLRPTAPTQTGAPATITPPATSNQPSATVAEPSPDVAGRTAGQPQPAAALPSGKTSPAIKNSASEPVEVTVAPKVGEPASSEPAMVVKNGLLKPSQPKTAAPETAPAAPAVLGFAPPISDEKMLAGIVSTTASVPKPVAPQTVRVSQGVSQGLLTKRVQPAYPAQALQMRIQGSVQLEATIAKDGSISGVKRLSGDSLLARAAIDAVRQWKYKPYYLNGEPVEIQTQITINFRLPQ